MMMLCEPKWESMFGHSNCMAKSAQYCHEQYSSKSYDCEKTCSLLHYGHFSFIALNSKSSCLSNVDQL